MIVLIANPTKDKDIPGLLRAVQQRAGGEVVLRETTPTDAGEQLAKDAVQQGATLVVAAGGDGTVQAVANGLAGSGVPLGIVALGTGNLLCRNLSLPLAREEAIEVALTGQDRPLDLGCVHLDDAPPTRFAVMAGLGFDADMMADAPEGLKAKVGWPAYVVSGLRHLRDRPQRLRLVIDDGEAVALSVRGLVIGNVGELQAGVALLPDALPDDGLIDVVALRPRNLQGWARVLLRLATRSARQDDVLQRWTAKQLEVVASGPVQAQLDGEPVGLVTRLRVSVEPGVLLVRVPKDSTQG